MGNYDYESVRFIAKRVQQYRERLTPRGRYILWIVAALALLGLDTLSSQVFTLFAVMAAMCVVASVYAFFPRPKVCIDCALPQRATALTPLSLKARVINETRKTLPDIQVSFRHPKENGDLLLIKPHESYISVGAEKTAEVTFEIQAKRRGRYLLRGPVVRATDPLRLATTREVALEDQIMLVYPRFYSMDHFFVPLGRRYQPGGIPLSSSLGDAIEFVGTREYREGDPVRNIHWRSWARRGEPVVKEFEEEYFCRIAIILDTFFPAHPRPEDISGFESAVSVVASIANYFSRSEYIVDILAAGPDIYEVSAGRSLAYLENILDVLACLEPCTQPPFEGIGPALFDKLAQITTVVAVLLDWDKPRENFLRRVKSLGTSVRAIVVRDGTTQTPWQNVGEELGEVSLMTPAEVERFLEAARANAPVPASSAEAR